MKTFLVPVDFSSNSLKAFEYALDLALRSNARVIVLHIYQMEQVLPGLSQVVQEESEKEARQKMIVFLAKTDLRNVKIDTVLKEGSVVAEINRIVSGTGVSLIIMGTGGGKNFAKRVFGTTTEAVAKRSLCPVIAIPEQAVIKPIKNIVYAADFENGDQVTTLQLLQLKNLFDATLTFLHIKSDKQPDYIDDDYIKKSLVEQFPEADLEFVEIRNKNVAEGIANFVQTSDTSLLAFTMLNKQLWEKVMYGSVTAKLFRNLKVPMLALPENGTILDLQQVESSQAGIRNEPLHD